MAEVNYNREPTVSVHGVPKSQYDSGQAVGTPGPGGGSGPTGIIQDIKAHPVWAVSIGIGVIAIAIMVYFWFQGRSSNTSSLIDPTTGQPYSLENGNNPQAMYGSQLDADYQQLISEQNQILGILQQIQQGQTGSGTPPPNHPPPHKWPKPPSPLVKGTDFLGPSGVPHYVTTGTETLDQIASEFGVGWSSIGGVPNNKKLKGWKDKSTYKPPAGEIISLPGSSTSSSFWASHNV